VSARGDDDLREELEAHIRMDVDERMARGESRERAERAARREFGNATHVSEVAREQHRGIWLERLVQDVRYGIRALRRTPAFTVTAIVTVALAIGVNSAVFSVVNGVLLRPLPFEQPDALFLVSYLPADLPPGLTLPPGMADRQWIAFRDRQHSFSRTAAYGRAAYTLTGAGDATRIFAAQVSASFFGTLGVQPALGRPFTAQDESSAEKLVLLSDALWRERFSTDPRVVGRAVSLDGIPYTVVGVMPPGFDFPGLSQAWTPLDLRLDSHNSMLVSVLARLRDGGTPGAARAELESIIATMQRDPRDDGGRSTAEILPLKESMTGKVATALLTFMGAVAFVLLIACVNVANLMLIRAAARRHEMAIRVALGASRARITRQLLTESTLVALAGGVLGIIAARAGVRLLIAMAPYGSIPRLREVGLDWWVVAFTFAVSILTGVAFGLAPALQSARESPQSAMAQGARTLSGSHNRLRGLLVSAEVALALVLLTGAGLMIKSFMRIRAADKGYDGTDVVTMSVELPPAKYPDASRQQAFHASMVESLRRLPGTRSVAMSNTKPMTGVNMMGNFAVERPTPFPRGMNVDKVVASAGYFEAMRIRLVSGRDFTSADDSTAPRVVIVSEGVARKIWPGQDPVGKRISEEAEKPQPGNWMTVVGVVSDVVQDRSMAKHPAMYYPYRQSDWAFAMRSMTYVVRTAAGIGVAPGMRAALRAQDPDVPALRLQTMNDALLDVVAEPLFQTRLLVVFSMLALLLAAVGTHGVLAYDVAERSREIALRMALGARPSDVIGMVVRRTGALALTGAAFGVAGSLVATRVLTASLYDVRPTDPTTMALVVAVILAVALAAAFVPARRAARVHVLTALAE